MTRSVNDLLSELANEYEFLQKHRNYLTDKLHQAVAEIARLEGYLNKAELGAEEAECANMVLDDMKVPRVEGDMALSLVGRIKALAAGEAGK